MTAVEKRRARRLIVNAPAVCESIGQVPMSLHPNLAAVFRRVEADVSMVGQRFPAVVRDLSTNGMFVACPPLPLLSRVAVKFEIADIGTIDSVGWVMWQRTGDCELPTDGMPALLPKGFGMLFEAIPLDVRSAIAALVAKQG